MRCFFLYLLLLPASAGAQRFAAVDKLALNTPPGKTTSVATLSRYLCAEQPDEVFKARAIYAWITLNVQYVDSTDERELWATPAHLERQRPATVLRNKTAVCQGYANLFCALAEAAGLPCEVITGLVKNESGEVERIGHAWVAAQLNGKWELFDPTWGVPPPGLSRWNVVDRYFMADPARFALRHLPDDPVWQLLKHPITEAAFREEADATLLEIIRDEDEQYFQFADTLAAWRTATPEQRLQASEYRILQFNAANERVLFGLGQGYWGLFFDRQTLLDSLVDEAIEHDVLVIDTLWFAHQLEEMAFFHQKARSSFALLSDPDRIQKAQKFYSPEDVQALLHKLEGDMYTASAQRLSFLPAGVTPTLADIQYLRYLYGKAGNAYAAALRTADCRRFQSLCFEVYHNRSLLAIQLAQCIIRLAQEASNDESAAKKHKNLPELLKEADNLLQTAIADCRTMQQRPPFFAFVEERIHSAQQGRWMIKACNLRVRRVAFAGRLEKVYQNKELPLQQAQSLASEMGQLEKESALLLDSIAAERTELGNDFQLIMQYNVLLENFALQFNLSSLQFRIALDQYREVVQQNTFATKRNDIKAAGNKALRSCRKAAGSLDQLEDTGKLSRASLEQKRAQVNKLEKAILEFTEGL